MSEIIRGYWDCPYCGTRHIDGLVDNCPHCGKQKSEDTKYYMGNPADATDILSEADLEAAHMTADECDGKHKEWVCHYCNQLNNWQDDACISCGAPREDEKQEAEWKCQSCGRMNAPTADKCGSCGAPRDNTRVEIQTEQDSDTKNIMPAKSETGNEHISVKAWAVTIACIAAMVILLFIPIIHRTLTLPRLKSWDSW